MFSLLHWQDSRAELSKAGVRLPTDPVSGAQGAGGGQPRWIHIGAGNLYRAFHAAIAQELIDQGELDSGIVALETFNPFTVDEVYRPYDNFILQVVMKPDGTLDERVLASTSTALFANPSREIDYARAKVYFESPELQLVTLSITEKGYIPTDATGELSAPAKCEREAGPGAPETSMGIIAALLHGRYQTGAAPIAMVSTDNFSRNGERFRESILAVVRGWERVGKVDAGFVSYVGDERRVSFPWSMIDRITPNPSQEVASVLKEQGWDDLSLIPSGRGPVFAGFANTEEAHYLVMEDSFPNGRPALEKAGVIMCDRKTAEFADTMKVTACLNPLHTSLAVYGCLLGHTRIWQEMEDGDLKALVRRLGYDEELPVVVSPGVIDPEAFIDELLARRLSNKALPDTPQRIASDTSQKMPIRFGHTIGSYLQAGRDLSELTFIPLVIAGWLRYLTGVDDRGRAFEPSPDPRLEELSGMVGALTLDTADASEVHAAVEPILADASLFGQDLYEAGLGEKIERMLAEELAGPGAVRSTLHRYVTQD